MKKTLIIVDVQNDFLSGGSLAVGTADADFVKHMESIRSHFDQIILTADNHPSDHISFSTFPPHCVAGTKGAQLAVAPADVLLLKGQQKDKEEFSPFEEGKHVDVIEGEEVYVAGLAGDFCVKQSLLDLLVYAPEKKLFAITDLIQSVDGRNYDAVDYFDGKVTFLSSKELL